MWNTVLFFIHHPFKVVVNQITLVSGGNVESNNQSMSSFYRRNWPREEESRKKANGRVWLPLLLMGDQTIPGSCTEYLGLT